MRGELFAEIEKWLEKLEGLLRRLDELKVFSDWLRRDIAADHQPWIIVVDTPMLLAYLEPQGVPTAPRKGVEFWKDPGVRLGTLFWLFEHSNHRLLLLPPYFEEVRYRLTMRVQVPERERREESDWVLEEKAGDLLSKLDDHMRWLSKGGRRHGTEMVSRVHDLRCTIGEAFQFTQEVRAERNWLRMRRSAVLRFKKLASTGRLVGLQRIEKDLGSAPIGKGADPLRNYVLHQLSEKRDIGQESPRNKADAEALAEYTKLLRAVGKERVVLFLSELDLLLPIAESAEKVHELEAVDLREGIRSLGYFALAVALIGKSGVPTPAEVEGLKETLARWQRVHSDLKGVAEHLKKLWERARTDPEVPESDVKGALENARRNADAVEALFNEARARYSMTAMSGALAERVAEVRLALVERDLYKDKLQKRFEALSRIAKVCEAEAERPELSEQELLALAKTVGDLGKSLRSVLRQLLAQTDPLRMDVELAAEEFSDEAMDFTRSEFVTLIKAALGRCSYARWQEARRRWEELARGMPEAKKELGDVFILVAGWRVWWGQEHRGELDALVARLERAKGSEGHLWGRWGRGTMMFLEGQLAYLGGDYARGAHLLSEVEFWRYEPLGMLRLSSALIALSQEKAQGDEELEEAIRILRLGLGKDEVEDNDAWRLVFENGLMYAMIVRGDEARHEHIGRMLPKLKELLEEQCQARERGQKFSLVDEAAVRDTLGMAHLEVGRNAEGSERKSQINVAKEYVTTALRLDTTNNTIKAHLGEVTLLEAEGESDTVVD